jgi:hypothetical protein
VSLFPFQPSTSYGHKARLQHRLPPQSDGHIERVNKVLEDLLRACVLTFDRNWESSLPYVEFSYNNSYQASIKMSPFEALYGRKCQTPLMWSNVGEKTLESCPDPLKTTRSSESAKELRRQQKERTQFRGRRFCLPQGLPNAGSQKIPSKREASSTIRRSLSYHRHNRAHSLPPSIARVHVRYP